VSEPRRIVRVADLMGMAISVHVLVDEATPLLTDVVDRAITASFADLAELDRVFSPFRSDSQLCRIQRGELAIADADARIAEVRSACEEAERATGGTFSAFWSGTFDPTGYVKGWGVEHAVRTRLAPLLAEDGVIAVGMNAGGDMQLLTARDRDWSWRVGIADPARRGELVATVELRDGAIATSGTAERGAHIVDPRTGTAAVAVASLTMVTDALTTADVWATAGVVACADAAQAGAWLSRAPVRSAVLVMDAQDGTRVRRWHHGVELAAATSAP